MTFVEFKSILKNNGGFISAHWDGTSETEERIKKETKATIRCIPLDGDKWVNVSILISHQSKEYYLLRLIDFVT